MKISPILVAAMAAGVATSAQAQMVRANDPAGIVAALQNAGLSATLTTDSLGDPLIRSAVKGHPFRIVFYGCKANKDCATITFAAGFDRRDRPGGLIKEWNRKQDRCGRLSR